MFVPEDYASYVAEMARETTWGDHITLQAAADAYGLGPHIITMLIRHFSRLSLRPLELSHT